MQSCSTNREHFLGFFCFVIFFFAGGGINAQSNASNTSSGSWVLPSKQMLGRTLGLRKKILASQLVVLASTFSQNKISMSIYKQGYRTLSSKVTCDFLIDIISKLKTIRARFHMLKGRKM